MPMPKLPPLDVCLVAESIRPETQNKTTILGFMGTSPHVEITFPSLPAVVNLALMLLCGEVREAGDFQIEVEIANEHRIILPRTAVVGNHGVVGPRAAGVLNFQGLPLESAGVYTVTVYSMGDLHSTQSFRCLDASTVGRWIASPQDAIPNRV